MKTTAPKAVMDLVARFEMQRDAYTSPEYNETQLRREFVDPLFEALGWDVNNRKGRAEAYKDVIHEDSIRVGGWTQAPDYCFRIGGTRKFFVEAKKPSTNLKEDPNSALQVRRYAWTAKLPLSILTDFEEFAVYDCRVKPTPNDKASTARVLYFTYRDYLDKWDEIASIFSQEAVLNGSFDKYADEHGRKKGTAEVDDAFLGEIEGWRDSLAKNIALRNPSLSTEELNFSVQRIIDRIIFLRICEDRGIENYKQLQALLPGANIYARLLHIFHNADDRYNSGIFHFQREKGRAEAPDVLTPELAIDDKVLRDIISSLYFPQSPYEFSVLSVNILGQVYEQFLGKVIRLTEGHHAKVEEKPEVRKAGGVYYTPTYIVDYIVKNTVGKLLEGKTPREVAGLKGKNARPLRILDPACGSGSFLLGAYQYLLDWHRDWYIADGAKKWASGKSPVLFQFSANEWRLTSTEKKRILLNHIFGVDIDPQAVEVTKLSLLLKVLENETEETVRKQLRFFRERALPDLGCNIKCGNSLIGPDFDMTGLSEEEQRRINPFDWNAEFPEIMPSGGFDAVIGNPPYVRQEGLGAIKPYLQQHFEAYHGVADLYVYFIERGVNLLRSGGVFSYIVANKWLRANYGEPLRRWMKEKEILEIIDFGDLRVFQKATTYPSIVVISNAKVPSSAHFKAVQMETLSFSSLSDYAEKNAYAVKYSSLDDMGWALADANAQKILDKIKSKGVSLGEYVNNKIFRGILTGFNEAFLIDAEEKNKLISEDPKSAEIIKPFLLGRDIKRYLTPKSDKYLIFTRRGTDVRRYPAIERRLKQFKDNLLPKPKNWEGSDWKGRKPGPYQWYEIQDTIDYYMEFETPKIILPDLAPRGNFLLDELGKFYSANTTYFIPVDDKYLLGILNSKLLDFFYRNLTSVFRGGYLRFFTQYLVQLPIRTINFSDPADKARHNKIVSLVERMLGLHKRLPQARAEHEWTLIERQIAATDREIDQLVYELYGLTDKEIAIVEESGR